MITLLRAMGRVLKRLLGLLALPPILAVLAVFAWKTRGDVRRERSFRLVWGPVPIISNKYWSLAMREQGFTSETLMAGYYGAINTRGDFDRYTGDVAREHWLGRLGGSFLEPYVAFVHALRRFDVFHHPYSGGFLGSTRLWRMEAPLLRLARKHVVIVAYGADAYLYSQVSDPSLRHALMLSYPSAAREEQQIRKRVDYWARNADIIINGLMIDGLGRWDVLPVSAFGIDTRSWRPVASRSGHDGTTGRVHVVHTPNHRGFKGTEFLLQAVRELQEEGLQVKLILLERVPNEEVRRVLSEEADILAEQFVATGYAFSAIEGMVCGLPVLANLDDERFGRLFRRYSYLDECPILSTTPESLREHLRLLVIRPELREALGRAGRAYVEKYHSSSAVRHLFGSIYRHFAGEPVDLMNLYHPLRSTHPQGLPRVQHPLVDGRYTVDPAWSGARPGIRPGEGSC